MTEYSPQVANKNDSDPHVKPNKKKKEITLRGGLGSIY